MNARNITTLAVIACLCSLLAATCFAITISAADPTPVPTVTPITAEQQYTPVLASVLARPMPVKLTDGLVYLIYELRLTNATDVEMMVETVEVRDPQRANALIATLSVEITPTLFLPGVITPTAKLAPAQTGILLIDLPFTSSDKIPAALEHWITVTTKQHKGVIPARLVEKVAWTPVELTLAVVIGPPVEGGLWLATNVLGESHHRKGFVPVNGEWVVAQRFAVDYDLLDDQNRLVSGDPTKNESYPQFGKRLIAVSDGVVVKVIDGMADIAPGETAAGLTLETAPGNHVILEIGKGVYALYAHFKQGSVAVREGERVKRGQWLGLLGNSGNTTMPHLHFHLMAGPLPLASNGIPYVIDSFRLKGKVVGADGAGRLQIEPARASVRQGEMPGDLAVVEFPSAGTR